MGIEIEITIDCLMQQFVVDKKGKGTLEIKLINVPKRELLQPDHSYAVANYITEKLLRLGIYLGNVKVIVK